MTGIKFIALMNARTTERRMRGREVYRRLDASRRQHLALGSVEGMCSPSGFQERNVDTGEPSLQVAECSVQATVRAAEGSAPKATSDLLVNQEIWYYP